NHPLPRKPRSRGVALLPVVRSRAAARGTRPSTHARYAHFTRSASEALGSGFPNLLACHPCLKNLRPRELLRVDLGGVAVDDDEVCPLARLQRSDLVLGKTSVSGAAGVGLKGLRKSEPLAREPAARRLP